VTKTRVKKVGNKRTKDLIDALLTMVEKKWCFKKSKPKDN